MPPLVSVLVPAYNAERWIADTIKSALEQTWSRKEIIVVDDGSRDRTLAIAQQFASENVCVVSQENQGAAAARNRAFELCQGDYIQWLDADDLLSSDKVEKQMESVKKLECRRMLFSAPWGTFMYRVAKARFTPTPLWCDLSPVDWLVRKMGQNLHMQTATWLASRDLTEAAGPWDNRLSLDDDGEYFCRVLLASEGVHFVPDAHVFYRNSGFNSLSAVDRSDKKLESLFLSMKLHVAYLRSLEESERIRAACLHYLQTWFIWFFEQRSDLAHELEQLAIALGGKLKAPRLSRKFHWMDRIFGHATAKRAQFFCRRIKWMLIRFWDRAICNWSKSKLPSKD